MSMEAMTETQIAVRDAVLAAFPDEWDKTEGSAFWNIASAGSIPAGDKLDELDTILEEQDPALMTGDTLTAFCEKFGVDRQDATYAEALLTITLMADETEVEIPAGTLFETETGVQYAVEEDITVTDQSGVEVVAVEAGSSGNAAADTITVIPVSLDGVESVTNAAPAAGGRDEETDIELYERYQIRVSGNLDGYSRSWYEYQSTQLSSVDIETAKCYAAGEMVSGIPDDLSAAGSVPEGWVLLIALGEGGSELTEAQVELYQEEMDPGKHGLGDGVAPPTAHVYCMAAQLAPQDVTVAGLEIETGYTETQVHSLIEEYLTEVFSEMGIGQSISHGTLVRTILSMDGVADMEDAVRTSDLNDVQKATLGEVTFA